MSKAAGSKLVGSIVKRIEAKAAYEKSSKKPQGITPASKLPS